MNVLGLPLWQLKISLQYNPISGCNSNPVISHSNEPNKIEAVQRILNPSSCGPKIDSVSLKC